MANFQFCDLRRKTCPTHRGLRHDFHKGTGGKFRSEDLPHSSGIKTDIAVKRRLRLVGRLAPLIRDKNQTALMVRSIKAVFASGVLSSCLDNAVLPVAEYGFFAQVQPLPDIQHLREGGRKVGQLPCADCAAKGRNLLLTVGKSSVFVP